MNAVRETRIEPLSASGSLRASLLRRGVDYTSAKLFGFGRSRKVRATSSDEAGAAHAVQTAVPAAGVRESDADGRRKAT